MKAQKIKIELELNPEIALLVATYLHTTSQGDDKLQKMLSESGKNQIFQIAQNMVDQICEKTDFAELRMRNTHTFLTNDFLNASGNINN